MQFGSTKTLIIKRETIMEKSFSQNQKHSKHKINNQLNKL
jgi:hypothetical protein